jgi:CRISPR-associated protein Cmr6
MNTRRAALRPVAFQNVSNAGLWLDKFIKGQNAENDEPRRSDEKPFKNQLIDETAAIETPKIYERFFDGWQNSLAAIEASFRSLEIDGRVIIGLGAESVTETSIALHRTYGVPFISGSALKGLAASYAHRHLGDDWKRETGAAHRFVFGSQDAAGFLVFHDALLFPNIKKTLRADVMTVHHAEYYGDKNVAPADWDSPVPIPFLSATGNYLAAISGVEGTKDWIEFVWLILGRALREEGIGAKASSGYGRAKLTGEYPRTARMNELEEARKKAERELIEAERETTRQQALIDAQLKHENYQAQIIAQETAERERQQQNAEKGINEILGQIKAVETVDKKSRRLFEDLARLIYKLENAERKRELSAAALAQVARLEMKIEKSDKWFDTLKKMGSEK